MLCQKCHEHEATVHLTLVNGPSQGQKHLCNVCCPLGKSEKEDQETMSQFLEGIPLAPSAPLLPVTANLVLPPHTTVQQLASMLNQKPFVIIADLMELGIFANLNHELDFETATKLARKHGFTTAPA